MPFFCTAKGIAAVIGRPRLPCDPIALVRSLRIGALLQLDAAVEEELDGVFEAMCDTGCGSGSFHRCCAGHR